MDISKRPLGHHRCVARELSICGDDFVGGTHENSIIHRCSNWRTENRFSSHLFIIDHRSIPSGQLGFQQVVSFLKSYNLRSSGRKPRILHLNHSLPIDGQIMSSRHFLANIEHQRIVARLFNINSCFIDISLAHFPSSAFGRGNINHLSVTCSRTSHQFHTTVGRIKVHQSIVVPKNAIAFTRQ